MFLWSWSLRFWWSAKYFERYLQLPLSISQPKLVKGILVWITITLMGTDRLTWENRHDYVRFLFRRIGYLFLSFFCRIWDQCYIGIAVLESWDPIFYGINQAKHISFNVINIYFHNFGFGSSKIGLKLRICSWIFKK